MLRFTSRALPVIAAIALSGSAYAQAFRPFQVEMSAYRKTDNRKRTENSKIWVKAPDTYRIEQSSGAEQVITIANGRDVWEVRSLTNECFHSKETADKVAAIGKQSAQILRLAPDFRKQGGKPAGRAKIGGVVCSVYRRRDKDGMTHTIWVQPDGRVRRMVSSGTLRGAIALGEPIATHQLESRVDFKWLPAGTMEEALFRPPTGVKITERAPSK